MKNKLYIKITLWIILILWIILATCLSSQKGSETTNLSKQIVKSLMNFFQVPALYFDKFHILIRRLAHVAIFFLLGGLLYSAFLVSIEKVNFLWLWAGSICSVYAIIDEVKKILIEGRHLHWSEVGLNVLGVWIGILFCMIFIERKL